MGLKSIVKSVASSATSVAKAVTGKAVDTLTLGQKDTLNDLTGGKVDLVQGALSFDPASVASLAKAAAGSATGVDMGLIPSIPGLDLSGLGDKVGALGNTLLNDQLSKIANKLSPSAVKNDSAPSYQAQAAQKSYLPLILGGVAALGIVLLLIFRRK